MSNEATSWAARQGAGDGFGAKLLLMMLANHAGKDGVTVVGRKLLARECGTERLATVTELFGTLERLGLVGRLERRRGNGSRTSDWTVLAPGAADRGEMIDATSSSGEIERPEEVVAIAKRGTVTAPTGGTESAPDAACEAEGSGTVSVGVRSGERKVQVRSAGRPEPLVEPSGEQGDSSSKELESPTESKPPSELSSRPDLVRLSDRMAAGIKQRHSRANVTPRGKSWLDPLRLLIDRDGYSEDEVEMMIDFVLADERTSRFVLSPAKLRAQRDELAIKAGVAQPADDGLFKFRRQPSANRLAQPAEETALPPVTVELQAAWVPIMAQIALVVDEPTRKQWLDGLHLHAAGDELVIGYGHGATRWVSERFGRVITEAAQLVVGAGVSVRIVECGCDAEERAA